MFTVPRKLTNISDGVASGEQVITSKGNLLVNTGAVPARAQSDIPRIAIKNQPLSLFDERCSGGGKTWAEDPTFDNTAVVNAAAALVQAAGGGQVDVGPYIWPWSGTITIPNSVNLIGPNGASTGLTAQQNGGFRAIHANAQLKIGNSVETAGSNRGGVWGGFSVNGGDISNRADGLMIVGDRSETMSQVVTVSDTLGDGVWVIGTQNSIFNKWNIARIGGNGITFDTYALALIWNALNVRACGGYHVVFQRTVNSWANQKPDNLIFVNLLVEDSKSGTALGIMKISGAVNLCFQSPHLNVPPLTDNTKSAMLITDGDIEFNSHAEFNGHNRTMEAIMNVSTSAIVTFTGRHSLKNAANAIRWDTGGHVRMFGYQTLGGITNLFHPSSTATLVDSVAIPTGLRVNGAFSMFGGSQSTQWAAIPNASGGATIDAEARAAINAILAQLRLRGDLAT